jgi:hypothetical protein
MRTSSAFDFSRKTTRHTLQKIRERAHKKKRDDLFYLFFFEDDDDEERR